MVHTDTVEYSAPVISEGVLYVWERMYLSVPRHGTEQESEEHALNATPV